MPYIPKAHREVFDEGLEILASFVDHPGEINYIICRLLTSVLERKGVVSYAQLSAYNAAVRDASTEFERRVLALYEDRKREEYGEVFDPLLQAVLGTYNPGEG